MAKQTFTTGQVLTAAQMTSLQQTAMLGGAASAKVASYVLVAADAGDAITMSNAGATTITVDTGLFAAGDIVTIINIGAGACTITAGTATVTTSGSLVLAQNQGGVLRFTSPSAAIFLQFATPASSGDIEGVTAGVGISGGGTSGTVTITNSMATAIDAKGDLVAGTGADAFSRLAVGANDTILTADSTAATGMKWATAGAAAQNFALINSGGTALSGSGTTTISVSGKNQLFIKVVGASAVGTFCVLWIRFNSDTAANYGYIGFEDSAGTIGMAIGTADTKLDMGQGGSSASDTIYANIEVSGANAAGYKPITYASIASGSVSVERISQAWYAGTSAITSVSIISNGQNFDAGTVYVYGA